MDLDPVLLSRFQFAWVIGWHILMPAFTVGMASYIAILEGFHFTTGREVYLRISMFWIRIFSVAFGVGVVSGVIMPFQFGTNWSRYADATSNVLGPLFAYEGITAFFLEAAFLGVLSQGLARGHLQPVLPLPPGAYGRRLLRHHRLRCRRSGRLSDPQRTIGGRSTRDAVDDAVVADGACPPADFAR